MKPAEDPVGRQSRPAGMGWNIVASAANYEKSFIKRAGTLMKNTLLHKPFTGRNSPAP